MQKDRKEWEGRMNELEQLRQQIDRLDSQLLPLFLERMKVCSRVADYKRQVGMPVLDAEREQQLLADKLKLLKEPGMEDEVYEFFHAVMSISRVRQTRELSDRKERVRIGRMLENSRLPKENPTVCYFGSEGAYSEEAAIGYFGSGVRRFFAKTFEDAFVSLKENRADYAVLPIENSSTGTIADVMDLLEKYSYFITGEIDIPIHHCLMGIPGAKLSDIRKVYSHEQGILQSREFLQTLSDVQCETYHSTALSAKAVAERKDKQLAAIAGKRNAEIYGLEILAENINSSAVNTTRFVVISKCPEISPECNKVSIAFTLPHESGQLHRLLACFAQGGLNLLKLESRPIPNRRFEYMFFVDFTGNLLEKQVREVTDSVIEGTQAFKLLGNYRAGKLEG